MKKHLLDSRPGNRSPATFFLLVFLFSIPIWVVGPVVDQSLPEGLPATLPISSLMAFAPVIAAVILVRREEDSDDAMVLLKRAFDFKRIRGKAWYVPILFAMPAMMVLQVGWMDLMGVPLPDPRIPALKMPASFVVFFVAALGEEIGWQGYAIDPLQDRCNALAASALMGTVWAVWHIVPLIQANRAPVWIAWQYTGMVATRILIVWLYNNTEKSVFAAILFHAMGNVSTALLPSYGWPYDPFIAFVILAGAAAIIILLWGPKTLARYRYGRLGKSVQPSVAN